MFRLVMGAIGYGLVSNADAGQGALEIEDQRHAETDFLRWVVIAFLEVAAIAILAFFGRLRWVGWASLATAIALGACAGPSVWYAVHPTSPEPRPAPTRSQCIERSGGDTRCPGG